MGTHELHARSMTRDISRRADCHPTPPASPCKTAVNDCIGYVGTVQVVWEGVDKAKGLGRRRSRPRRQRPRSASGDQDHHERPREEQRKTGKRHVLV